MKELLLAPDLYEDAVQGRKLITIRAGYRDFEPDDVIDIINADDKDQYITRTVSLVLKCKAFRIPLELVQEDGFSGKVEMEQCMRRFYPDFTYDNPVTVIGWSPESVSVFNTMI